MGNGNATIFGTSWEGIRIEKRMRGDSDSESTRGKTRRCDQGDNDGKPTPSFVGSPQLTGPAKAILGAFGEVTGIADALLGLRNTLSNKLGQKAGFQWLLVIVAVVFFVLLSIVISLVLVLIRSRSWMQSAVK